MSNEEFKNHLEDAFWAGYNARQKQLDISIQNTFNAISTHYQRARISEQEVLEKVIQEKVNGLSN